jgi:hypothetical protein
VLVEVDEAVEDKDELPLDVVTAAEAELVLTVAVAVLLPLEVVEAILELNKVFPTAFPQLHQPRPAISKCSRPPIPD